MQGPISTTTVTPERFAGILKKKLALKRSGPKKIILGPPPRT